MADEKDVKKVPEEFVELKDKLKEVADIGIGAFNAVMPKMLGGLISAGKYAIDVGSKFEDGMSKVEEASDASSQAVSNLSEEAKKMGNVAGDTLNGKIDNLNSSLEVLGISAYQKFQEPIKKAVDTANNFIGELVKSMSDGKMSAGVDKIANSFSKLVDSLSELVVKWTPQIIDGLAWILDHATIIAAGIIGIKTAIMAMNVANVIKRVVVAFNEAKKAQEGLTVAQYLYNIALKDNIIGIIISGIIGFIAAMVVLWNTNEGFRDFIISSWTAIYDTAMSVWGGICTFFTETIPAAFQAIIDFFAQIPQFFSDLWNGILTTILAWGDSVNNFFTTTIPLWINNIITWFGQLPYNIGYALGFVLGTIIQWGIDTVNYLVTNVPIWINNISNWFSQLPVLIWNWLLGVVNNIVAWGTSVYDYLVNNVPIWINNVIAWFTQLPDSIWAWLVNAFNNIVAWGVNVYNSVTSNISSAINSIIAWFSQLPSSIWGWLVNTINNLGAWGANMVSQGGKAASDLVDSIENIISSLPDKMLSIGQNIVRGMWDGICGMGDWIAGKIDGFANGVIDGFKDALGIHSPSRVMRDIVGINIVKGIGVGIEYQMPDLNRDIIGNLDDLTSRISAVVGYETYRNSANAINSSDYKVSSEAGQGVTNNNDNGVTQNITFNNPVSTPSETARAIKRVGRELVFG